METRVEIYIGHDMNAFCVCWLRCHYDLVANINID